MSEAPREPIPPRRRVSILWVLLIGFGAVVAFAGVAFWTAFEAGRRTTLNFIQERTDLVLDHLVDRVRHHMHPAEDAVRHLANLAERGELDLADTPRLGRYLALALAGVPQVTALTWISEDLRGLSAQRQGEGVAIGEADLRDDRVLRARRETALAATGPFWGDLVWSPFFQATIANLTIPVRREGRVVGGFNALVAIENISGFIADDSNAFILYGKDAVLGHPQLARRRDDLRLGPDRPLPSLQEVGDTVLAHIWSGRRDSRVRDLIGARIGHVSQVGGRSWVFIHREIAEFGPTPWLVGRYFPLDELREDTATLRRSLVIGGGALVAVFLLSFAVARLIGPRLRDLAAAADRLRRLDFEGAPLAPSAIREIDEANRALDASREALSWFATYVPRKIVWRLMAQGEAAAHSRKRQVTVLFTDIVGYTPMAEAMSESEIEAFLNAHFALIGACIEAEGGQIDKYIGDAVMAVWGAVDKQPDHADRACRAAIAIAQALAADNARRRERGEAPVQLRLGLHSGPVIAGNIGAPGRINFTIVGDAVNTAQRIENLARDYLGPEDQASVLVSEATVALLASGFAVESVGRHALRGRQGDIEIFRLVLPRS
ncbi:MAG: adenylate/guanylate cyclase domain-containing protein [Alphaproteobacteria bacterium]|nr:adenylate/guanylate cyclase domain-containing protein [Alphaproteobacteria bacterium]